MTKLTQERLRELFAYDADTGEFISVCPIKGRAVGEVVGSTNKRGHVNNISGITGVSFSKSRKLWVASLKIGTKSKNLGGFSTKGEAAFARFSAEVDAGWPTGSSAHDYLLSNKFLIDGKYMQTKIGICGGACSGKTTVYSLISKTLQPNVVLKYADMIYKAMPGEKKRGFMCEYGDLAKKYYSDSIFRDIFAESVLMSNSPHIICDDIRTPEEVVTAKRLGFTVIYIDCPDESRSERSDMLGYAFMPEHNSESSVLEAGRMADYTICNSGSLDELEFMTEELVERITS